MKNRIVLIISVLLFILSYFIYEGMRLNDKFNAFSGADEQGTVIKTMPDIKFKLIDSSSVYSFYKQDLNKKKLFLHFWATWCGPCEAEFPKLEKMINEYTANDVSFVFVAVNDELVKIRKFLKKFPNLDVVIALDNDFLHQKFFGVYKLPETFIVDSSGAVIKKFTGAKDWKLDLVTPFFGAKYPKVRVESH